jgi:TatD DNase family protein
MYFDSHAHLTSDEVFPDIDGVLQRAKLHGVGGIINICTDLETLKRGLELAKKYPWVYNTASTTPHDVDKEGELVFPVVAHHARQGDLVAIGETGLDYFHHHSSTECQQRFLRKYLQLALECSLPVVIHCREAFSDFFKILDEEYRVDGKHAPGVLHCFTGTMEEAEQVVQRGWYLSLSGIVTFKNSNLLRQVAVEVPLDQLLIETDAPYLAPQSFRGKVKINEPAYITETARVIAVVKQLPVEQVAEATARNAKRLFGIS